MELSIFASAARGEMRPDSDIDVLVEFAPDAVYGWEYFGPEQELSEIFGRRADLATKRWLKGKVRAEVLREARVLYAADANPADVMACKSLRVHRIEVL